MILERTEEKENAAIHALLKCSVLLFCLAWFLPGTAHGETEIVAPSQFLDTVVEGQPAVGGVATEDDALGAQAARIAEGEDVPGVSREAAAGIEEIVVSARKREELLEDTPLSVTALGEELLRETGTTRLDEIKNLVPNLQIITGRGGQDAIVRIRGVGTANGEIAFDPGVGIYVDGVFLPRSLGSLVQVLDVAQIEVLRGPQGTLFGK
ncbi:Plug domain-containing protein, partial [Myxococcota bacterium]|nr:Plug domain-containing protein [Myxococcota bacterium]